MADEAVLRERVRDFVYDCTRDEFQHGWTLSAHQTDDLIAMIRTPSLDSEDALKRALAEIDDREQAMIAERKAEYGKRYSASQEASIKVTHFHQRQGAQIMAATLNQMKKGARRSARE